MNMSKSNLKIADQFAECERENLRQTGAIQYGVNVFVFQNDVCIATTSSVTEALLSDAQAVYDNHKSQWASLTHVPRQYTLSERQWFVHQQSGYVIFETNDITEHSFEDINDDDLARLEVGNLTNVWKLSDRICQLLSQKVSPARVMIYKFHEDWSGEVIAERVSGDLEQFLGLRYPATDIPKIARELFLETKTRHLFNLVPPSDLEAVPGIVANISEIDLTYCISRSISPFHIEYLKNMGSMSTQSSSIIVDGKLWGLISLHFDDKRPPSLQEFMYFQNFSGYATQLYEKVINLEKAQLVVRSNVGLTRFTEKISDDVEPFHTLVLSDVSIYKIIGGQGMSLIMGAEVTSVGLTPNRNEIEHLTDYIGSSLASGAHFYTQLPDSLSCSNNIAGLAIYIISHAPLTCVIIYRKEISQTISWGGDPRHDAAEKESSFQYSPRKSFQKWVENVRGQSAPWTASQMLAVDKLIAILCENLEVTSDELSILLKNGMRRAVKRRDQIRNSASEFIDSISSGIAIGIEKGVTGDSEILAINNVASESFNVSLGELYGTSFNDFMNSLGISELEDSQVGQTLTISTANNGVREVEFRQGVLFDYVHLDKPDSSSVKLIVYEFTDITEATRIKNSLIAARDRAISETKMRNEMMAKLSHELKTPLHGLIGISDLLKLRFNDATDEKDRQLVRILQKSAYLMQDFIDYTLKSSTLIDTIDSNNFRLINVKNLINDISSLLQPLADKQEIELIIKSDESSVYAEPRGIRQVLINILENAIKYNIFGGKVTINCNKAEFDQVFISITDTGVGMTKEELRQCIEPYQRFSNKDGSGLGLPIAESLIRAMGGHLDISSTKGVGTTMVIRLSHQQLVE